MISVLAFPVNGISYTECFYPALESLGVKVQECVFAGRWLLANLRQGDYVHLHWPSFLYGDPRPAGCLRKFALFLFFLALARWRGARIVWTVHNLYPHDRCVIPQLDQLVRWLLVRVGWRFPVHGSSAEAEVLRAFPAMKGKTIVIDHGHWIGYYPNSITRDAAYSELGLTDRDFVFLFIGACKPYKNIEMLVDIFASLPPHAVLLIAGRFTDPNYESTIRKAIEQSPGRVILHAGYVADEKMQVYLNACDVVVTPYAEILTSGTAMLALSFGRPVIAPARGFLKDTIVEGCGVLYDPRRPDDLARAMQEAMNEKFDSSQILSEAAKHDWKISARRFLDGLTSA